MSYILQTSRLTKTIGGKELVRDVEIGRASCRERVCRSV